MLQVVWSQTARERLAELTGYVARDSSVAAEALRERIEQSILPAAQFPYMFRTGRRDGTREVVAHPNYILVYRVLKDRIRVITVLHTSQQYP